MSTKWRLIAGGCGSIVAAVLWTVAASYLFLLFGGLLDFPLDTWTRCTAWWTYISGPHLAEASTKVYLAGSGLIAALPIAVVLALIFFRPNRGRGLAPPFRGSVRPVVSGVTDNHGHATVMTAKEIRKHFPGPRGVTIGEMLTGRAGKAPLVIDPIATGGGHSMVVAGTRSGKSMSAITALLHWDGSAVSLDASEEMGGMLKSALEAAGKRVYILNPGVPKSGFNALSWINPAKPLAAADVKSMVAWIFPDDANARVDPYFEPTGRSLCTTILADLLWSDRPSSEKTLKEFRSLLGTPENLMAKFLETIHSRSKSAMARDLAGTLMRITPKQFSGVYGQATEGCHWLSDPDLADLVSGNRFRSNDILDGRTVVFAQIPLRALKQSPGVGRVIIGSLMSAVYEGGRQGAGRTFFCLDEAHALGRMAIMEDALVVGAKYGLVLQFLYQSTGQAKRIWGDDGINTLYNNLTWRAYAAVRDDATAEMVSKEFGEIGVMAYSEGENSGTSRASGMGSGNRSRGNTKSVHEIKRRLILSQEVRSAPPDELFVISMAGNMRLRMPLYFRRPDLAAIVHQSHFVTQAASSS